MASKADWRQSCPAGSFNPYLRESKWTLEYKLCMIMEAIVKTELSLGDVLQGIFTPHLFDAPATRPFAVLIAGFLRGDPKAYMASVLERILRHPDSSPRNNKHCFSLVVPYQQLNDACSVLTSWAAQACANRQALPGDLRCNSAKTLRALPPSCPAPSPQVPSHPQRSLYTSPFHSPAASQNVRLRVEPTESNPSTSDIIILSNSAVDNGASADIFVGELDEEPRLKVALKVFRHDYAANRNSLLATHLKREILAWQKLRHPRLLPFLGTSEWNGRPVLIAPYMTGNLLQYVERNPEVDRLPFVLQVLEGLVYLHEDAKIVHGDLKCQNVLVTESGTAMLADFGLSTLIDKYDDDATTCSAIRWQGTLRFSAPEILDEETFVKRASIAGIHHRLRSKTPQSDIYAFGMFVLQLFTGASPWEAIPELQVIKYVLSGLTPPRPGLRARQRGLNDFLWRVCHWCWQFMPSHRPHAQLIRHTLTLGCTKTKPDGMLHWLGSTAFKQQQWVFPVLNGILSIIQDAIPRDALTSSAVQNLASAIASVEGHDKLGMRTSLTHFSAILEGNPSAGLGLLDSESAPVPWQTLYRAAHELAPPSVLDIALTLATALRNENASASWKDTLDPARAERALHLAHVLLDIDLAKLLVPVSSAENQTDEKLQLLLRLSVPELAPDRWPSLRAGVLAAVQNIPSSRRAGVQQTVAGIDGVLGPKKCLPWSLEQLLDPRKRIRRATY